MTGIGFVFSPAGTVGQLRQLLPLRHGRIGHLFFLKFNLFLSTDFATVKQTVKAVQVTVFDNRQHRTGDIVKHFDVAIMKIVTDR